MREGKDYRTGEYITSCSKYSCLAPSHLPVWLRDVICSGFSWDSLWSNPLRQKQTSGKSWNNHIPAIQNINFTRCWLVSGESGICDVSNQQRFTSRRFSWYFLNHQTNSKIANFQKGSWNCPFPTVVALHRYFLVCLFIPLELFRRYICPYRAQW